MSKTLKQILSGVMIAGDIFLILIFLFLMFDEVTFFPYVPLMAFLAIDMALSLDYIMNLKKQKKVELDQEFEEHQAAMRRQMQQMKEDMDLAAEIKKKQTLNDLSVEELQELLQKKQQQIEYQQRQ